MNFSEALILLNYGVVLLYGVFLTASFSGALKSKKDWLRILAFSVPLMVIQAVSYKFLGMALTFKLYPLLIHLPLVLFLSIVCKRKMKEAFPAVFIAYLCCIPRQWLGMLVAALLGRGTELSCVIQIALSFPLLALTIRFISPLLNRMLNRSGKSAALLTSVPLLYYCIVFVTTVYSNLLYNGGRMMFDFILSILVFSYFFSTLLYSFEVRKRYEAEKSRELLHIQNDQAIKDLESMRHSQQQAATYWHDLRHHFQYLASCIDAGKTADAREYIRQTSEVIEAQKVIPYCVNEPVNLILSAYRMRADAAGVEMDIKIALPQPLGLPVNDLCIILSNGFENALHACEAITSDRKMIIEVRGYQKNGKTFFQIQNPYEGNIAFKDGRPAVDREGHGLGTLSIAETVKRYGGMCSFSAEDGLFTLRFLI